MSVVLSSLTLCSQIQVLLDTKKICVTLIDFVRFHWLINPVQKETSDNGGDSDSDSEILTEEYDNIPRIYPVEYGDRYWSAPTIWIGVVPDTLVRSLACHASKDILALLISLDIHNIDIAFREAVSRPLSRDQSLLPPAEDGDPIQNVIDNVSVALSIPIAGLTTNMQGTLGPYFHFGDKLFAITVRHNLFVLNEDNSEYRYNGVSISLCHPSEFRSVPDLIPYLASAAPKEVMFMSKLAFKNYLASIQAHIGTLIETASTYKTSIANLTTRVQNRQIAEQSESQKRLDQFETDLAKTHSQIELLKRFFVDVRKRWSKDKDRVIGFVRWAPSYGVGLPPDCYTRDLCVIELDKKKFRFMIGNVLSLGAFAASQFH